MRRTRVHEMLVFRCESVEERAAWVSDIQAAIAQCRRAINANNNGGAAAGSSATNARTSGTAGSSRVATRNDASTTTTSTVPSMVEDTTIGNAIYDATGARLREAPFTPARVKTAIAARA